MVDPWAFLAIPSVRPSVTNVDCIKTAEHIIETLSLSDGSTIPVFRHQGLLRKSDCFIRNGGRIQVGSDFRPIGLCGYISENGNRYLQQKTNINAHVLYRIVLLSMTLSDPEPQF